MTLHFKQPENGKRRFKTLLAVGAFGAEVFILAGAVRWTLTTGNNGRWALAMTASDVSTRQGSPSMKSCSAPLDEWSAPDVLAPPDAFSLAPEIPARQTAAAFRSKPENERTLEQTRAQDQKKQLGARIDYGANRLLQMLTRKYDLSNQQQALVFPVIARALPAYGHLPPSAGEALTDADLAALGISPKPVDPATGESDYVDPGATLLAKNEPAESETMATTAKTRTSSSADDFDAALALSLDSLEAQLVQFLDSDQLALMNEEQIDRFYWWGEILLQISGDIKTDAALVTAALGSDSSAATGSTLPVESGSAAIGSDSVPAAHQDGSLLDLLYE
jgi:hypothetical protein